MSTPKRGKDGKFVSRRRKPRAEAYPEPIAYPTIQYPTMTAIEAPAKKKKKKKSKKSGWIW